MTTPRDIPLTPRDSQDDPTLSPNHHNSAILAMDEPDEHDQLLPSSHDNDYNQSSEIETLLGDHDRSVVFDTVWMILQYILGILYIIN
jgi:hypothetical protein